MIKVDSFTISAQHPSLNGHFPGNPIVPGVVLLERVEHSIENHLLDWQVSELIQVKFLLPVLPGQTMDVEIDLTKLTSHQTVTFQLYDTQSNQKKVTGKIKCIGRKNG